MSLRRAGKDDVDELVRIINLAFQVEKFFIAGDRIDVAQVRELLTKGEFLIDAGACVYIEQRGDRCYLGLLSVDPAAQGTGLGRRLLRAAEERACELGCRAMDLRVVNLRAELPAFYHHMGYSDNGTEEFTPGIATLQPCHFLYMTKALL
jgi:GNAT superfamily N-acetyltransferase